MRDIIMSFALGLSLATSILSGVGEPTFGVTSILFVIVFPLILLSTFIALLVQHRRMDRGADVSQFVPK